MPKYSRGTWLIMAQTIIKGLKIDQLGHFDDKL